MKAQPSYRKTVRFARHVRGQALVLGMALLLVLSVGAILLFNTGQVVNRKVQLTNAADAAAYSVAVQQASAWNFAAYMNRGRVANEVAVAQLISIYSWMNQLNTSAYVLKTVFNILGSIPFPPVAIPARVLYVIFNAADNALVPARRAYHQVATNAIKILDEFNGAYARMAEIAIRYSSRAEAIIVARDVVTANLPRGNVSGVGLGVLGGQLLDAERKFLDFHALPRRNQRTPGFDRFRNVVMQSRDEFSWNRGDKVMVGPIGFASYGGTDMVEYNRWAALDTMQLKIKLPWPMDDIDVPVGWGGAQAVDRYQGQAFLPGIRSGRNNGAGWLSEYDRRTYGIYGGMNGRDAVTRLASNDPNVSVHRGQARGAYFPTYNGLRAYHDVKPAAVRTPNDGPRFTVHAEIGIDEARTSTVVNIGSGRMQMPARLPGTTLSALATAQVYFNRPRDYALFRRGDNKFEAGSLFSPYWQARLVETPTGVRALLGLGNAVGAP